MIPFLFPQQQASPGSLGHSLVGAWAGTEDRRWEKFGYQLGFVGHRIGKTIKVVGTILVVSV